MSKRKEHEQASLLLGPSAERSPGGKQRDCDRPNLFNERTQRAPNKYNTARSTRRALDGSEMQNQENTQATLAECPPSPNTHWVVSVELGICPDQFIDISLAPPPRLDLVEVSTVLSLACE